MTKNLLSPQTIETQSAISDDALVQEKPLDGSLHSACSALDGREVAQIVGVITALAAITSATPSLIIGKLTGTLWTIKEASDLLNAAKLYEPLNDHIIQDLVRRPNTQVRRQEGGEIAQSPD